MSRLFTFLENFDPGSPIRIVDENSETLFEGAAGDVPLKVTRMRSVIKGSAVRKGDRLEVKTGITGK